MDLDMLVERFVMVCFWEFLWGELERVLAVEGEGMKFLGVLIAEGVGEILRSKWLISKIFALIFSLRDLLDL